MNREDPYRQKTESTRRRVGRATVQEQVKPENLPPRSELHRERRAKKKKKVNIPWIRLQVAFFILLPIAIFVIYTNREDIFPKTTKTTVIEDKGGYETISIDNDENKKSKAKEKAAEAASKDQDSNIVENQPETEQKEEETPPSEPIVNQPVEQQVEQPVEQPIEQPVEQTIREHTVQAKDTLYSIAKKYYGAPNAKSGIQKIKQANNLPNENIRVGQKLIIPQ